MTFQKGNKYAFKKGNKFGRRFQKGHRHSKSWKEKMSKIRKGVIPWNKGLNAKSDARVAKISGKGYWNWRGGITPLVEKLRHCFKYCEWRSLIFQRDKYTCHKCGKYGGNLEAHHLKSFSEIIKENHIKTFKSALNCEKLWDVNNGITLCKICHRTF